eukprot:364842-Chlamydomonas_euryale.AAC.2
MRGRRGEAVVAADTTTCMAPAKSGHSESSLSAGSWRPALPSRIGLMRSERSRVALKPLSERPSFAALAAAPSRLLTHAAALSPPPLPRRAAVLEYALMLPLRE